MVRVQKARLNVYIDPDVHAKVMDWSNKSGMSVSHLINQLLSTMFNSNFTGTHSFADFWDEKASELFSAIDPKGKMMKGKQIDLESFKEELKQQIIDELKK